MSKDPSKPEPRQPEHDLADEISSVPTVEEEKIERNLMRKIDLHILPFVVLLYLFSFLDRGTSALWSKRATPQSARERPKEAGSD